MGFRNREEAGRKLADRLMKYKNQHPVILALPRGGVPVAAEIAAMLDAPLDLILVRKLGVPWQPELAMGAIADGDAPLIVRNEEILRMLGVGEQEFREVCDRKLAEIERRRERCLGGRAPVDIAARTAIVVDDGIATGATTRAALRAARMRGPKNLVLATPVAPTGIASEMRKEADEVVCLEEHEDFVAIGFYYRDFRQVEDREVITPSPVSTKEEKRRSSGRRSGPGAVADDQPRSTAGRAPTMCIDFFSRCRKPPGSFVLDLKPKPNGEWI